MIYYEEHIYLTDKQKKIELFHMLKTSIFKVTYFLYVGLPCVFSIDNFKKIMYIFD